MVKYLIVMFLCLLSACSKPQLTYRDPEDFQFKDVQFSWPTLPGTEEFSWNYIHGFRPSKNHLFGFDKHPNPALGSEEDAVTHLSIEENYPGSFYVFINPDMSDKREGGYTFALCKLQDLNEWRTVAEDENGFEEETIVTDYPEGKNVDSLGLCKYHLENSYLIEKMYVHSYKKKEYPLLISSLGQNTDPARFIFSKQMWNAAANVYAQAGISFNFYGYDITLYIEDTYGNKHKISYILSTVKNADTSCYRRMDDIFEAEENVAKHLDSLGISRSVLSLNLPTKEMWTLIYDDRGNVQVCGTPEIDPATVTWPGVELKIPASVGDSFTSKEIRRNGSFWEIQDSTKKWVRATKKNVNVNTTVMMNMAEQNVDPQYVKGHISETALGVTNFRYKKNNNSKYPYDAAIALIPWQKGKTARVILHEMGHLLGLQDALDLLSRKDSLSEQGNLMYFQYQNGTLLRERKMKMQNIEREERQWDCLQRIDEQNSCSDQDILHFNFGE